VKCKNCRNKKFFTKPDWLCWHPVEFTLTRDALSFSYHTTARTNYFYSNDGRKRSEVHIDCATVKDLLSAWIAGRTTTDSISYATVERLLDKQLPPGWKKAAQLRELARLADAIAQHLAEKLERAPDNVKVEFDRQTSEGL